MKPARRPLRIALALVFFMGLTTVGLTFLTPSKGARRANRHSGIDPSSGAGSDHGGFFYKSLGQTPVNNQESDDSNVVKVASASGYTVEFSAHPRQREAEQIVDSLRTKGITAYYTPLSDSGRIVYRVRKGLYTEEAQATVEAKSLAKVLGKEPKVVRLE
jgi:hypothetical protein